MGKIYFVRHGETQANTGEHFDQEQLIRLTANGHKQAKKVARKIKRPSKFFASLYFRTLETAQYAMGHHKNIPLQILPHVHEFSYLEHDEDINSKLHLTHEEKYKRVHEYWALLNPYYKDGKNSESFKEFVHRVASVREFLKKNKWNGDIYIFTHGNFSRLFRLMHFEFKDLSKKKKLSKKELTKIMARFSQCYLSREYTMKNCEVIDVTNMVK